MKYAIGLDCGIASVGYSVVELDSTDEPRRIIRLGSRIFDKAEHPKDGSSLALPRREARSARRRLRRHKHRLERIRYLIVDKGILSQDELDELYSQQVSDIYELRCNALDKPVDRAEFARIMINLAQRRGFKSNRKVDSKAKENGALLSAIEKNKDRMYEHGYRTVGEMLFKDEAYAFSKRNKGENYLNTVTRDMIEDEIVQIFKAQRSFGMPFASEETENAYKEIVLSQRPFDVGPGQGPENCRSPYAGDLIERMVGKCTFYPEENRAAKATYSFQLFSLLQGINNIKLVNDNGTTFPLTDDEKKTIKDHCFKTKSVNYAALRKKLGISDEYRFKTVSYGDNDDFNEVEKKTKFEHLKAYHEMKKVLGDAINTLSVDELDEIGRIFTCYKNDDKIKENLEKAGIDKSLYDALLELPSFSKFCHISTKALKQITPYLEQGMIYNEACEAAGIDFKAHNKDQQQMYLPAGNQYFEDITNPVVKRAVSQTIKVINSIIREQGHSPTYINIELARELSKTYNERRAIEKRQNENRAYNDKIIKELEENFGVINPLGLDIVKLKLYHEQGGVDAYDPTSKLDYEKIIHDPGYVDVDHIIPYSLCFDDTYNNKILTSSANNRQKGNRLPLQYIPESKQGAYRVWVENNIKNYRKKKNLLKENFNAEDDKGFIQRNLQDTQYLSSFLLKFIKDNLLFEEFNDGKKIHVNAVNGAVTSYIRKRWGITKIREDGDLHHAVDATVIACTTTNMTNRVSQYSKYKELEYCLADDVDKNTGEVIDRFPMPYPTFRKELEMRVTKEDEKLLHEALGELPNYTFEDIMAAKPSMVSRMPRHKVTGQAHLETVRSPKALNEGYAVSKTALSNLKLDKNGDIADYYEPAKRSDELLYQALKNRLIEFGGDGKKAFPQGYEFHKPKADGTPGPIVKKVQVQKKTTSNVKLKDNNMVRGIADNGSMVRIDVFYVDGEGYYFVPIYVADTVKDTLPNKACVAYKDYEDWKEMDDENFCFSLYSNDLIKVTAKKPFKLSVANKDSSLQKEKFVNEELMYFKGAGISVASISVVNNDNSYKVDSMGIKSLVRLEKYTIDPIGNVHKVNKEKRMYFK